MTTTPPVRLLEVRTRTRPRFRLTPKLDLLNDHIQERRPDFPSTRSGPGRLLFNEIRRRLERWVDRALPGTLSLSEMAIVRAVATRTLPFEKYAEQITHDQMLRGLREHYPAGPYILDAYGLPVWTGTGLDPRTARSARAAVHAMGLITTFPIRRVGRRPTTAYMLSTPQVLSDLSRRHLGEDDQTHLAFHELLAQACNPPAGSWCVPRAPYHNPAEFAACFSEAAA